jgi:hypothetical protein
MNNQKEILELSKWLHEKGFECDKAAYVGTKYPLLYDMRDPPAKMIDGKFVSPFDKEVVPYFTLNRALELLPEEIVIDGIECYLDRNNLCYYGEGETNRTLWFNCNGFMHDQDFDIDYYVRALRLLKQVVEKGYITITKRRLKDYLKGESDEKTR